MATVYYDTSKGRWAVRWFSLNRGGRRATRRFRTEGEARAFVVPDERPFRSHVARPGRRRRNRAQVIDHLAANFEPNETGCWVWTGALTNEGYARMTWKQDGVYAVPGGHRVILHALGFPVPRDRVVDHLCRNRACINPDHLDVVQQRENVLRSPIAVAAINAAKTHCPHGHEYTAENTYLYTFKTRKTTTRVCRACQHGYYLARRARRLAEVSA